MLVDLQGTVKQVSWCHTEAVCLAKCLSDSPNTPFHKKAFSVLVQGNTHFKNSRMPKQPVWDLQNSIFQIKRKTSREAFSATYPKFKDDENVRQECHSGQILPDLQPSVLKLRQEPETALLYYLPPLSLPPPLQPIS